MAPAGWLGLLPPQKKASLAGLSGSAEGPREVTWPLGEGGPAAEPSHAHHGPSPCTPPRSHPPLRLLPQLPTWGLCMRCGKWATRPSGHQSWSHVRPSTWWVSPSTPWRVPGLCPSLIPCAWHRRAGHGSCTVADGQGRGRPQPPSSLRQPWGLTVGCRLGVGDLGSAEGSPHVAHPVPSPAALLFTMGPEHAIPGLAQAPAASLRAALSARGRDQQAVGGEAAVAVGVGAVGRPRGLADCAVGAACPG